VSVVSLKNDTSGVALQSEDPSMTTAVLAAVKAILQVHQGASVVQDMFGQTPLHRACGGCCGGNDYCELTPARTAATLLLRQDPGIAPTRDYCEGQTALHLAARAATISTSSMDCFDELRQAFLVADPVTASYRDIVVTVRGTTP